MASRPFSGWQIVTLIVACLAIIAMAAVALILGKEAVIALAVILVICIAFGSWVSGLI